MKKTVLTTLRLLFVAALAIACTGQKEEAANDDAEWREMDDFHMIMAETFHPFKDSTNLEPVKSRAGELAAAAENWTKAALPARVDNDQVKSKLQELKEETSSLVATVQTGDDQAIGDQLTRVHDLFHSIQESWYENAHDGHEHGHEH